MSGCLFVDAHVHVHPAADVDALLASAVANFAAAAAAAQSRAGRWQGVLMLAEMRGVDWFGQLTGTAGARAGRWPVRADTGETISVRLEVDGHPLLIVAGRQVVTVEGIEVLALATRQAFDDGLPLPDTLRAAQAARALIVLPWGAGKWLGRRGALVGAALQRAGEAGLYAGDNGGRPALWPRPAQFALATAQGRPLLSGSDPLPLPGEERRVGSYGFRLEGELPQQSPAAALVQRLAATPAGVLQAFGSGISAYAFIRNQLRLRLRRRPPAAAGSAAPAPATGAEAPDVETSSAAYASRFRGAAGRYLLAVQSATVQRALTGLSPGTVLDVGGGHGQLVEPLQRLGWRVTVHGTDAVCERHLRELHGQRDCAYVNGPLAALPAADQSFDLVIAVRLISHVERWRELIAEMCRVARGSVVIDYPNKSGLNALTPLLFGLKKSMEGNTRTYASFSAAELRAEFARHGFARARSVKQFFLPMVAHRVARGAAPLRWAESLCRLLGLTALAGSPVILRMDRT